MEVGAGRQGVGWAARAHDEKTPEEESTSVSTGPEEIQQASVSSVVEYSSISKYAVLKG